MKNLLLFFAVLVATKAYADVGPEYDPPVSFSLGYLVGGDEEVYMTWDGKLAGKPMYIEIHGPSFRLVTKRHAVTIPFRKANNAAKEPTPAIQAESARLYLSHNPRAPKICVTGYEKENYRESTHFQVYVIEQPFSLKPRVTKLPSLGASCIRESSGQ